MMERALAVHTNPFWIFILDTDEFRDSIDQVADAAKGAASNALVG